MGTHQNIVDLGSYRSQKETAVDRIIRIAPELDGLETLYRNDANPDMAFNMSIVAWALKESGDVVGLVPWLDNIIECPSFTDPLNGEFAGYLDPSSGDVFYDPPIHKIAELESNYEFFADKHHPSGIIQELPETLGTHALLTADGFETIHLHEVISWQLTSDGQLWGMLSDYDQVEDFPVLKGDDSLYPAQSHPNFKYFFHFSLVSKIKHQDPDAISALALLSES